LASLWKSLLSGSVWRATRSNFCHWLTKFPAVRQL
jgi:hypothetical protein